MNLDPYQPRDSFINVPVGEFGWLEGESYQVHDLDLSPTSASSGAAAATSSSSTRTPGPHTSSACAAG